MLCFGTPQGGTDARARPARSSHWAPSSRWVVSTTRRCQEPSGSIRAATTLISPVCPSASRRPYNSPACRFETSCEHSSGVREKPRAPGSFAIAGRYARAPRSCGGSYHTGPHPAGDRDVSPDGLVGVPRLSARAPAPLPSHQDPAGLRWSGSFGGGLVLFGNAGRNAPPRADRDALVFRPRADVTTVPAA
jgi:hypothetical protein